MFVKNLQNRTKPGTACPVGTYKGRKNGLIRQIEIQLGVFQLVKPFCQSIVRVKTLQFPSKCYKKAQKNHRKVLRRRLYEVLCVILSGMTDGVSVW
jgi:hypothetical protein